MIRAFAAASVFCLLLAPWAAAQDNKGNAGQDGKGRAGQAPGRSGQAAGRGTQMPSGGLRGMGRAFMGQTAQEQAKLPVPPQEELNKKLAEALTGATLIGVYTTDGAPADQLPKEDKYTLDKVTKLPEADLWSFEATVAVGGRGMSMPIVVAVKWAGDTPMIQLTSTSIPGMGTYNTRIFFYDEHYAGTWQHGPVGGVMYGRIVKEAKPADAKPADSQPADKAPAQ